jgi:hypothetical protein
MNFRHILLIISVLLFGCVDNAPRDNPLDPLSPSYSANGTLSGKIIIAGISTPLGGVTVTELSGMISVTTDSSGLFLFTKLSQGNHRFICTKQNFTNDTFSVEIRPSETATITRGLNGAPVVNSQQILTRKIDQYFPGPQYFVDIAATVTDPNGVADLDSVWFSVDTLLFPLSYSVNSKNFIAAIYKYQLPTNTIQWLVGKPLKIISRDRNNAVNAGSPFYVTRVIESSATPKYFTSAANDTATSTPLFTWTPPNVTFHYSYTIIVSRVESGTQTIVWLFSGLNSFFEEKQYPTDGSIAPLPSGNYVWTITVVDDFGNYARSKEASFTVK